MSASDPERTSQFGDGSEAGLDVISFEDLSANVSKTWDVAIALALRPMLWKFRASAARRHGQYDELLQEPRHGRRLSLRDQFRRGRDQLRRRRSGALTLRRSGLFVNCSLSDCHCSAGVDLTQDFNSVNATFFTRCGLRPRALARCGHEAHFARIFQIATAP